MNRRSRADFIPHPPPSSLLEFSGCDLFYDIRLDLIADLKVIEVFQADAAFKTFAHFRHVVFKATQ